jgi:hypothetical protein
MPIRLTPRAPLDGQAEAPGAPLAEMITAMAEAVAEGQLKLDLAAAEAAQELAQTKIQFIPAVRQIIDAEGKITFEHAPPAEISLLDLGMQPTFYAFSEALLEVAMDLRVIENAQSTTEQKERSLFASTRSIRTERKLNRDVKVSSKFSAKLVPVPGPALLRPERSVTDKRAAGGGS